MTFTKHCMLVLCVVGYHWNASPGVTLSVSVMSGGPGNVCICLDPCARLSMGLMLMKKARTFTNLTFACGSVRGWLSLERKSGSDSVCCSCVVQGPGSMCIVVHLLQ